MANIGSEVEAGFSAAYVESVRIRNFRGLADCALEFAPDLTLLVGRNNSGKSRVLRALALALAADVADIDDLTVGTLSSATIDVVVAPPPPNSETSAEEFETTVGQRLGADVQTLREEPVRERFAWRTTIRRSAEGLGARTEMQVLVFDHSVQEWALQRNAPAVSRDQRNLFAAHLVETRRDLVDELSRRGSAIRRVLSDLEVSEERRQELETQLSDLSVEIVDSSATLEAVKSSLESLETAVGSIGSPALNPLPLRLEEMARSVAIELDSGGGSLPIRLHGSGARSLASLQIQGVLYDRRLGRDGPELRPRPLTLVEEPEAHLHPQACLELSGLLSASPGQVIVSTHSSHFVTSVDPSSIRLIRQEGGTSTIVDLGPARSDRETVHRALRPSHHADEMEKLKRLVERPFGELLFASAIVVGDGATERAFLPIVIRHALGGKAHGVCVIDPGSMGNDLARAVIKFAKLVYVPWLLFADSDGAGTADAKALLAAHAGGDESYVVWVKADGRVDPAAGGAIEAMLVDFDETMCRNACLAVRPDLSSDETALQMLARIKGSAGSTLARRLVDEYPCVASWPETLRTLVTSLDGKL